MKIQKIASANAPEPGGWYSQAFRAGQFVFTAGVTAHDPETGELIGKGDIQSQTRQVLRNMEQILLEAGSDMQHVIKTLAFISDVSLFDQFNAAYKEFFPENPPARSTMQVGKFKNEMMVEIEAVAVVAD